MFNETRRTKKISITFWSFVNVLTNEIYLEYIQSFHKRYQNEYMYKSGLLSPWFKILGGMNIFAIDISLQ